MARAVRWPAGAVATGAGNSGESQRLGAAGGCDGCLLLAQLPAGCLAAGLAAGCGAEGCCRHVAELQTPACHPVIVKALFSAGIWCVQCSAAESQILSLLTACCKPLLLVLS